METKIKHRPGLFETFPNEILVLSGKGKSTNFSECLDSIPNAENG